MTKMRKYVALIVITVISVLAIPTIATFSASNSTTSRKNADSGQSADEIWTRQFGSSNNDFANAVAVDALGNSYLAGGTDGTLSGQTSGGGRDVLVRKYDPAGNELWTRQFGTIGTDVARGIAVDSMGNTFVAGETNSILPGQTNSGFRDAFVRKYDGAGDIIWTRQFGTSNNDLASFIGVDAMGNSYVAGATFGTLPGQTSSGGDDAFVRKYDPAGNELWTRQFGTSGTDISYGIAVDTAGNSYVAGYTSGTFSGQTNSGSLDAFVRKYDTSGNAVWTRQFGTNVNDVAFAAATDSAGNCYLAGGTFGTLPGQTNSGGDDAFVRKYDQAGNEVWTRQFGTSGTDLGYGIALDSTGNSYVAGEMGGSGVDDAFVRRFDPAGNDVWTRQFGTGSFDSAYGIAVASDGNSYVAGETRGTLPGQTNAGNADVFIRKYTSGEPEAGVGGFLYAISDRTSGNQIYGYEVNEATGALSALSGFPVSTGGNGEGATASELIAIDQVNRRMYAINDGSNTLSAFSIDPATGALTALPFSPITLGSGFWLTVAVHPSGSPVIVGDGGSTPSVVSFHVTATTAVAAPGSPYIPGASEPFSSKFSADGSYLYTGGNDGNLFAGYSVNSATGELTALPGSPFNSGGTFPLGFATDTQGRIFSINGSSQLRAFTTSNGVPAGVVGNPFPSGLNDGIDGVLSPNGNYFYAADRGQNRLGVYQIAGAETSTTMAALAGTPIASGGQFTNALTFNKSGAFLYAANGTSRNITTFNVNPATGAATLGSVQNANTLGFSGTLSGIVYFEQATVTPTPTPRQLRHPPFRSRVV